MKIGIIGGTGVYDPGILHDIRTERVDTAYGEVELKFGHYKGEEIAFLARHGWTHSVPPHRVNYRANISALKDIGVERVIATSAVGSLNPSMKPGDFVILDQFLDFTKCRESTFFDGQDGRVVHVDFTQPYCPTVRESLIRAGRELGLAPHEKGCYVATEGPRFETPAEIHMYRMLGGDVVGMTGVPEVVLAREAGLCYGTVAIVTNFAAGISKAPLTHAEVVEAMKESSKRLRDYIMRAIDIMPRKRDCSCGNATGAVEGS
ncbi:MAG TPA: S-methyl-5'-thioadenosine phosphorylase [Firmicutes bacterium]|nr:S-methyl-5'-thioadenosine phosphorylase [Bacillota bacterium]